MKIPHATLSDLERKLKEVNLDKDPLVRRAVIQADSSHQGKFRYSEEPVLTQHIYPTAISVIDHQLAAKGRITGKLVAAALLHDVIDDDPTINDDEFKATFGNSVYRIIKPLIEKHDETSERKYERLLKEFNSLKRWWTPSEARIIRLADLDNNFRCMHTFPYVTEDRTFMTPSMEHRLKEIKELILPFAEKFSPYYFERISSTFHEYNRLYNPGR